MTVEGQLWPVYGWAIDGPNGTMLVDTGMIDSTPELDEEWGPVLLPWPELGEVVAVIDKGALVVSGRRVLPAELRNARILRLELPQGRFERRIPLPLGRYTITRFAANGCVGLRLAKSS